jgi:hypothetical protein
MAHVDTQRTPWIWRSRRTFRVYLVLGTLGVLDAVALTGCFLAGTFGVGDMLRLLSLVPAALENSVKFSVTFAAEFFTTERTDEQ